MVNRNLILKIAKRIFIVIGGLLSILLVLVVGTYVYHEWFWQEWSPARIERITGIKVPQYKVIECNEGNRGFTGDYENSFSFEFKTNPSDDLFDEIDKKIATGKSGWRRDGNTYSFSITWGNGYPAPKGEREEDDGMFSITITRGEKGGRITYGAL